MNSKIALISLAMLIGYFFLSMMFYDWTIPVYELPIIGPLIIIKPFQMLEPWSLFIGGGLVLLIAFAYRSKRK